MKNVFTGVCLFFLGFAGVIGFRYFQGKNIPAFTLQTSSFTFKPPAQAKSGILTETRGKVEKLSRDDNDYYAASPGAQILIGESVATKVDSHASVTVEDLVTTVLESNAELVFANLFPENTVLQQKSGTVRYDVSKDRNIAVRALHALISIISGTTTVTVIGTNTKVSVITGFVKVALVDADNNTHVYGLQTGERAVIDDEVREIYLSPR